MFAKKVYDINPVFENGASNVINIHLDGYTTQQSLAGFSLKSKNKLSILKPDIQISFDATGNKATVTANSIPKFLILLGIAWVTAMISLFAILFITGEFAYAIKFWFGVIIGAWIVIPTITIVLYVLFRKASKQIFEEIYTQLTGRLD